MNIDLAINFLEERTALSILSREILKAIALQLKEITINADELFIIENNPPHKLYILISGQLESNNEQNRQVLSLLPGSALNLYAIAQRGALDVKPSSS